MNEDKANQTKQTTVIVWYDAGTMRALVVALVGLVGIIASLFGADEALFSDKAPKIIDALSTILTLGGVIWAGIARSRQPTPPISLTQAGADQHNADNPPVETRL